MTRDASKVLRCAVYTRVSTEHGLDQDFNSLDNQREAAEAYIKSQAHEGWRLVPAHYDDGGFSGGSMERPALQRLLEAIRSGAIDVVVVYKVDRLTRSLADFAKLVELFDANDVSFVSVTQAFNTTTSMGRLTLNVLLSFAQFEREVTGERIRDKIAASKRKGLWMGGTVPLGYRVQDRKLLVDESEAETVRLIFTRYLEIGSTPALQTDLRQRGIRTRRRKLKSGRIVGGIPFTNGPLGHLLRNRVYLGEITHKGMTYQGEHEPLVSRELFDSVQRQLAINTRGRRGPCSPSQALLLGKVYDDRGNRMTPAHANKGGARYRYYVSCVLAQGRPQEAGSVARVPAPELEAVVLSALSRHAGPALSSANTEGPDQTSTPGADHELARAVLDRVVVRQGSLEIHLDDEERNPDPLVVPWSRPPHTRKREVIAPVGVETRQLRPMRPEARLRLLNAIARARSWVRELTAGEVTSTAAIAEREAMSDRSVRMTLSLAFIAPALVEKIVAGSLPRGTGLTTFTDLPNAWAEQRRHLGLRPV